MRVARFPLTVAAVAVALVGCQASGAGPAPPSSPTTSHPTASNPTASNPTASAGVARDNGIAKLSATEIAKRVTRAINKNSTVHVKGAVSGDGQTVTFDVNNRNLVDGRCTLTANGQTVEVIRIGGNDYAKADAKFWTALGPPALRSNAAATQAAGKYVKASAASSQFAILTKFLYIAQVVWDELAEEPAVVKGGSQVVNGVPTITITSPELGKIYIATRGEPYVIRVEAPGGVSTGFTDFSDYRKPVEIDVPPADQVIDISALKTTGG